MENQKNTKKSGQYQKIYKEIKSKKSIYKTTFTAQPIQQRNKNSSDGFFKNNQTSKNKTQNSTLVASLNARSLKSQESLDELENALENSNLEIIGLSEITREGETIMRTKKDNVLCFAQEKGGQKGVGFLIKKNRGKDLREFKGWSDRVSKATL